MTSKRASMDLINRDLVFGGLSRWASFNGLTKPPHAGSDLPTLASVRGAFHSIMKYVIRIRIGSFHFPQPSGNMERPSAIDIFASLKTFLICSYFFIVSTTGNTQLHNWKHPRGEGQPRTQIDLDSEDEYIKP